MRNWSVKKRDQFFVSERDEYSTVRIKELLDANPTTKALIFYGDAHLQRDEVQKLPGNPQSSGYFLAHYLTDRYPNNGGVYICGQVDVLGRPLDDAVKKIGRTFALDQPIFDVVPIGVKAVFNSPVGTAIYHFVPPRQPRQISEVYSRGLVNCLLDSIVIRTLLYLCNVAAVRWYPLDSRKPFMVDSTIRAWKKWRDRVNPDIVDDLARLEYFRRSVERVRTAGRPISTQYEMQLAQLTGFKVWFQHGALPEERADSGPAQNRRLRRRWLC